MFTGIIEELGKVQTITKDKITVECVTVTEDAKLGDSIAVDGVCLTVVEIFPKGFVADVSPETMRVTNLKSLKTGSVVNLERAMRADGRFGGHIVSGHIDGCGKLLSYTRFSDFYDLRILLEDEQAKYVVQKGSIAINGISLTIASVNGNEISIAVIPHTFENTNLKTLKPSDFVNIEVDITAKYIEKFLSTRDNKSRLTLEYLHEHGF